MNKSFLSAICAVFAMSFSLSAFAISTAFNFEAPPSNLISPGTLTDGGVTATGWYWILRTALILLPICIGAVVPMTTALACAPPLRTVVMVAIITNYLTGLTMSSSGSTREPLPHGTSYGCRRWIAPNRVPCTGVMTAISLHCFPVPRTPLRLEQEVSRGIS